jgi:hypothetical protein
MEEPKELRAAGLTKAYIGVETGDGELLKKVKKALVTTRCLRQAAIPGGAHCYACARTVLYKQVQAGDFELLDPFETLLQKREWGFCILKERQ